MHSRRCLVFSSLLCLDRLCVFTSRPLEEDLAHALSRRTNGHTRFDSRPAHLRLGATSAPRWRRGGKAGHREKGIAGDLCARLPRLSESSAAERNPCTDGGRTHVLQQRSSSLWEGFVTALKLRPPESVAQVMVVGWSV